jgi:hypothetical protein
MTSSIKDVNCPFFFCSLSFSAASFFFFFFSFVNIEICDLMVQQLILQKLNATFCKLFLKFDDAIDRKMKLGKQTYACKREQEQLNICRDASENTFNA